MSEQQLKPCPICSIPSPYRERYPRLVCSTCRSKACDDRGRQLKFFNVSMDGGFQALLVDSQEEYPSHICYIEGIKCWADEGKFGGWVRSADFSPHQEGLKSSLQTEYYLILLPFLLFFTSRLQPFLGFWINSCSRFY